MKLKLIKNFSFDEHESIFSLLDDTLLEVLTNPVIYEEQLVKTIGEDGLQINVNSSEEIFDYLNDATRCIKIEGIERFSPECSRFAKSFDQEHSPYTTIHAFRSLSGSPSFDYHTDPSDVYIAVIHGEKAMLVIEDGVVNRFHLRRGDLLYIPRNTVHKAINEKDSIMLSIGVEPFLFGSSTC